MPLIKEQGSFEQSSLSDLLVHIWDWHYTGRVRLDSGKAMRILVFKEGCIVGLTSDQIEEALEEFVRRTGSLSGEQIDTILDRKPPEQDLPAAFIQSGLLSVRECSEIVRKQIITVVAALLPSGGDVRYMIMPSRIEWEGPAFPVPEILLAAFMSCEDRHWVAERLGMDVVYEPGTPLESSLLVPYPELRNILRWTDGLHTVEDICRSSSLDNFSVCRFLYSIELMGGIRRRIPGPVEPEPASPPVKPVESTPPPAEPPSPILVSFSQPPPTRSRKVFWVTAAIGLLVAVTIGTWVCNRRWRIPAPPLQEAPQTAPTFFSESSPADGPKEEVPQTQTADVNLDPLIAAVRAGDLDTATDISRSRLLKAGLNLYVIVLEIDCLPQSVQQAFAAGEDSPRMFVTTTFFQGRRCYNVCWGLYQNRKKALGDTANLPEHFRRQGGHRVVQLADLLVTD